MSELWLIAHKVRGAAAFDVATQMECPECKGRSAQSCIDGPMFCSECDEMGFWWIVPTSGHRAYPWWHLPLQFDDSGLVMDHNPQLHWTIFDMPPNLPDHYTTRAAPRVDLATALGLRQPVATALPPLPRRL